MVGPIAAFLVSLLIAILAWRLMKGVAKRYRQDMAAALIMEQQSGQIPFDETANYCTTTLAVDEFRAGRRQCEEGKCLVCESTFKNRFGEPAFDRLCGQHVADYLKAIGYFALARRTHRRTAPELLRQLRGFLFDFADKLFYNIVIVIPLEAKKSMIIHNAMNKEIKTSASDNRLIYGRLETTCL